MNLSCSPFLNYSSFDALQVQTGMPRWLWAGASSCCLKKVQLLQKRMSSQVPVQACHETPQEATAQGLDADVEPL